ncbi:MAG: DUF4838 domain-containing protein [Clostridia bacterium]|nr:DUF4838 domain-containing protein [Clostridia bacterium]
MMYTLRRVFLPDNAPEQAVYAAGELRYYLALMCGKPCPIESDMAEDAVVLEPVCCPELGEDGFRLIPEERAVRIQGGKRGIIYGAYELLEMLGCRFFTPECEKVPVLSDYPALVLDEPIVQVPVLEYREHNYTDLRRSLRFAVKSRVNGAHHIIPEKLGGYLSYAWYVHTFERLVPPKIYGESHPEYYAMLADGTRPHTSERFQLCLTNPEVLEIAIESVRQALKANPKAKIISISQNDWLGNCQCEHCLAIDREEGSPAGTLLRFVNAIAERLEPEFPDVIFDTLAYNYTRPAPSITRPRHNVCVRLCSIEACFAHSFETCDDERRWVSRPDGSRGSFIGDLEAWGKVSDRVYIWDYTTCFAHYPTPHPNWHVLGPNMKAFIKNHVRGVFEQANGAYGGGVDMNELRAYVISKLLWNAEADVAAIIEDFTDYYYGAAGVYIREYIETLCGKAERDNIHVGFNDNPVSELFSEEMLDAYDAILAKAEQAVAGDALRCRRVQKVRLSIRWVRIKRAGMLRHEHDAEAINAFFTDWQSFGLTRIDEWVSPQSTLRALLDDKWRGTEYLEHWSGEGGEIL